MAIRHVIEGQRLVARQRDDNRDADDNTGANTRRLQT